MSPILKRDVAETVRQARRLAAAAGLREYDEYGEYELDPVGVSRAQSQAKSNTRPSNDWDVDWDRDSAERERDRNEHEERERERKERRASISSSVSLGRNVAMSPLTTSAHLPPSTSGRARTESIASQNRASTDSHPRVAAGHPYADSLSIDRASLEMDEIAEEGRLLDGGYEIAAGIGKWADLRGLLFSVGPPRRRS